MDRARTLEARAESMRTILPDDDAELHIALTIFLREIFAATRSVRIGISHVMPRDKRWSAATKD